eukprot:379789_1
MATPIIISLFLFSNFFVRTDIIPVWVRWIKWIDCFYYGTELLCIYEFKGELSKDGFEVGNYFLNSMSMSQNGELKNIVALITLFIGLRIIALFFLVIRNG